MLEQAQSSIPTPPDLKPEGANDRQSRRKRLRLSCGECRSRKLACDRNLPCQRCVRSGRPEQCSFETSTRLPPVQKQQSEEQIASSNSQEVQSLRAEVAHLRELLSKSDTAPIRSFATSYFSAQRAPYMIKAMHHVTPDAVDQVRGDVTKADKDISDPRESSLSYYNQHTLLKFFHEIPQLFPFIKEISDEWLKPLGIRLGKTKHAKVELEQAKTNHIEARMEDLIPSKEDTDELIMFYTNHVEQVHRIIHIPTFRREYANFWAPRRPRQPAMTALVLAMMSISQGARVTSADDTSQSGQPTMTVQRIGACECWLRQQSSRHRKLVHYQIAGLIYLAKRMNIVRKKLYWKETGSLIQDAISDGLHLEPSPSVNSPYIREMKRRIWATLRELDLQNCVEFGLPTLLHSIEATTGAPSNIIDEAFDEVSEVPPTSADLRIYTDTSYQFHSALTWGIRLELSRRLFSPKCSKAPTYEEVLQLTHQLTQAFHSVPTLTTSPNSPDNQHCQLASAFLKFQLIELILAMHRPYLQREGENFWLSENICYQMARDILLLSTSLASSDCQRLVFLREDLLVGALSIARITLLQPNASMAMSQTTSTIELLELCIPMFEDRYRRCTHEMWCFITMYSAFLMIKVHLGRETWQSAKSSCAQRFLAVYFKQSGKGQLGASRLNDPEPYGPNNPTEIAPLASDWLDNSYSDFTDPFDLDVNVNGMWGTWIS
ncbi:hypothetical protein DL98DRAFT_459635 [Cadophora sp. DSE1049]|nr:hypothetical protein DL98DRAFT_459635 [Cadophora sp. DSE1049]